VSRVTVLIADDEPLARRRIRSLLSRHPEVEVVGEAEDGRRALQMVRSLQPALLFLDIQMPELNGFEVLEELPAKMTPEVIFVTAYDRFALRAFEVHALDYLLKPFTRARFTRAVDHCLERLRESPGVPDPHLLSLVEALRRRQQEGERVAVREKDSVELVRTAEIDWLEGAGNYVKLHVGTREHLVRDTLRSLEARP